MPGPTVVSSVAPAERIRAGDEIEREIERLLGAIRDIAPVLVAGAETSDVEGRLVQRSVEALRSHDLWRMRLCRELGGLELPIVAQIRVLASLAAIDTSSAWCTMVANSSVAVIGATMPDQAVERVFGHGVPPCTIVAAPGGKAVRTDSGYQLNGTWRLASAIHHAEWIHATANIDGDPSRLLPMVIPKGDVELIDSWDVVGLSATGSNDFTLRDYILDEEFAGREAGPFAQVRGRRRYDLLGLENIESYEHLALALGVARRALHELRHALAHPVAGRRIADREVVQIELGRATVKLQAIQAATFDLYGRIDAAALGSGQALSRTDRSMPRALAAWATEAALDCVQLTFRRSGVAALRRPNILEKLLRDMSVAATHFLVNDTAFSAYAERLIEAASLQPATGGGYAG